MPHRTALTEMLRAGSSGKSTSLLDPCRKDAVHIRSSRGPTPPSCATCVPETARRRLPRSLGCPKRTLKRSRPPSARSARPRGGSGAPCGRRRARQRIPSGRGRLRTSLATNVQYVLYLLFDGVYPLAAQGLEPLIQYVLTSMNYDASMALIGRRRRRASRKATRRVDGARGTPTRASRPCRRAAGPSNHNSRSSRRGPRTSR